MDRFSRYKATLEMSAEDRIHGLFYFDQKQSTNAQPFLSPVVTYDRKGDQLIAGVSLTWVDAPPLVFDTPTPPRRDGRRRHRKAMKKRGR